MDWHIKVEIVCISIMVLCVIGRIIIGIREIKDN